jgi:hypothetical protein
MSRLQHGGPSQRVSNENSRRLVALFEKLCRGDQIPHVRRKIGLGKVPFTFPQTGEVESQNANLLAGQGPAQSSDGPEVFRAGKAMCEKGVGVRSLVGREVEPGCKLFAPIVREVNLFERHGTG